VTDKEELSSIGRDEAWFHNVKRTVEEYQELGLESARRNRTYVDRITANAENHSEELRQLSVQSLQNSVETANMIGKQAVAHRDIAIDHEWNLEPSQGAAEAVVLRSVTIDDASLKAIGAVVAAAVAESLGNK